MPFNVKKLLDELQFIELNPRQDKVEVVGSRSSGKTEYWLKDTRLRPYYYPLGIEGLCIDYRGQAIYVYTTQNQDPHLTVPFDGNNIHWTPMQGVRKDLDEAPSNVRSFVDIFSKSS